MTMTHHDNRSVAETTTNESDMGDEGMSEVQIESDVPIENAEAGASLPSAEEVRTSVGPPPKKVRFDKFDPRAFANTVAAYFRGEEDERIGAVSVDES